MAQTITFDMYVRTDGRWQQQARFIELERDEALETAQKLDEDPDINGVRIIRVTSFGTNRAPLETLEWISPSLNKNAAPSQVQKRLQASEQEKKSQEIDAKKHAIQAGHPDAIPPETNSNTAAKTTPKRPVRRKSKPPPAATGPVWIKIFGIVALSTLLAIGMFAPATFILKRFNQAGYIASPLVQEIAALILCALVFLLLVGISLRLFITAEDQRVLAGRPQPAKKARRGHRPQREPVSAPQENDGAPNLSEPNETTQAAPFSPQIDSNSTLSEPEKENDLIDRPARPQPIQSSLDEQYRLSMLRFLEGSLSELADILTTLDQYSRFGINLFLGGAGDQFSSINGLGGIQRFILIKETISALGTQADMVDVFCEKFDAYDKDPKYHFMTEAGRRILDKYLAEDPNCFAELPDLIRRWRRSNSATAQAQGIIVIMFTDLVGSTQMTHDHGDLGAQEVVRAHNAIVRNALAQYHGEEVKHTGDGIMASFANAPNSVRATIEIQREIEKHNAANPNLPVRVRIGLNAGDAVREEDDFFGQTVQLAARICDKADEQEIYITPSVHSLCADHAFEFMLAGEYELKGIDEPVQAYAVRWREDAS